jgi:hypothetical protein
LAAAAAFWDLTDIDITKTVLRSGKYNSIKKRRLARAMEAKCPEKAA